jgi:hypothetical protein
MCRIREGRDNPVSVQHTQTTQSTSSILLPSTSLHRDKVWLKLICRERVALD